MKHLLFVFGTRPEAIKMAPLIIEAKKRPEFNVKVCSTGQHREMLIPILSFFGIKPDFDLNIMKPGQTLADISIAVLHGINKILNETNFDLVIVQGDTTSCFVASLAAFYNKVKIAHIEAGLRSGDIQSPFPEEFNRKATGLIADLHFAPTETSKQNLLREHYSSDRIFVTGNTGIDALFAVRKKLTCEPQLLLELEQRFSFLRPEKKLILVTVHRRESFGRPLEQIMKGLKRLSERDDIEILIPLHLNPHVRSSANSILGTSAVWTSVDNIKASYPQAIWMCDPIEYIPFVYLMNRSYVIVTDSGGVQEEAPSLGKPILVAREKTERPEAIDAGTSKLVPLDEHEFFSIATDLIDNKAAYAKMAQATNPFGDGNSSARILDIISTKR